MRKATLALAAFVAVGVSGVTRAANIDLTFNDLNTGALAGQGGGTGASGNWVNPGSAVSQVITGDLTAPAGTNFSVNQGGNPRSVQSTSGSNSGNLADYRTLATSLTGTTWFSFLINPVDANARVGIGLNATGNMGGAAGYRILAVGTSLFTNNSGTISGTFFTLGTGNLVVGQITSAGGNEELKLWVNPNVATFQASTPTPTYDSGVVAGNPITGGSISNLTPISYTSGGTTNWISCSISSRPGAPPPSVCGITA